MKPTLLSLRRAVGVVGVAAMFSVGVGCSSEPPGGHRSTGLKYALHGDTAYRMGQYGVAAQRYRLALMRLRAADDQDAVAQSLHNYGMSLKAGGECRSAIVALAESAELHRKLEKPARRALNLLAIGECQFALRRTGDATASLGEAITWAKKGKDYATAARATAGIGAARALSGRLDQAAKRYADAEKLAKKSGDAGAQALVANNRGRLLVRRGDHASAVKLFLKAADGFRKSRDPDGLASALANAAAAKQSLKAPPFDVAMLHQRAGHAATAARRYHLAASSFAAAARHFDAAGKTDLATNCRNAGRQVLDALQHQRTTGTAAAATPGNGTN